MPKRSTAPGLYVARWPDQNCRIDLLTATSEDDVLAQLDEFEDTSGVQVAPFRGPVSFTMIPKFGLRWKSKNFVKVSESSFGKQFEKLLKRKELSDFAIHAKGSTSGIPVHKLVLIARSTYFDKLISGSNIASHTLNFPAKVVNIYVNYLYSDNIPYIESKDSNVYFQLLQLAKETEDTRLRELCEEGIDKCWDNYSLKNICKTAKESYENNATQLKKITTWLLAKILDPNDPANKDDKDEPESKACLEEWKKLKKSHPDIEKDVNRILNGPIESTEDSNENNNNNNNRKKKSPTKKAKTADNTNTRPIDYYEFEVSKLEDTPGEGLEWEIKVEGDQAHEMISQLCKSVLPEFQDPYEFVESENQSLWESKIRKSVEPLFAERKRKQDFKRNIDLDDPKQMMMNFMNITSDKAFDAFVSSLPVPPPSWLSSQRK